ncbi:hypothetical protein DBR39_00180 [Chryseobacterium sp. KBW03]|uniref:hypothetical protein n=1 Tax=Chryseobacterium sp. KBW03 TaxID=2153362 RepID=UPI000F597CE1|nr:hypothetical protein [Chryseobacterium sp. KBW03]RQO42328.1 hypothetical protein DBR39_00180 [Chryseobacterium sp. KBW03]
MKRVVTKLIYLFPICGVLFFAKGQGKNYVEELNRSLPQSPGVSSLMKFEEVPVSLYTGIPDVNIPIENFSTNSSKLNLNISLNYHPLSAKVDDVASEYGLGWSLFAGGMISRTIRDLPDESDQVTGKYGIYFNNLETFTNNYNIVKNYLQNGSGSGLNDQKAFRQIFESVLFNRFDNSYDLYQYNFMGYTGRFFIKRDETTGFLKLVKLDKNNFKIDFTFDSKNAPLKFEITDDKGLKYVFNVVEKSSRSYLINTTNTSNVNTNDNLEYQDLNTGFHLSEVYEDNKLLVKFNYSNGIEQSVSTFIAKRRGPLHPFDGSLQYADCYDDIVNTFPADYETSTSLNHTYSRFLDNIEVKDRAKIYFEYTGNRMDSNLTMPNNNKKLSTITIKDFFGSRLTKQYNFDYAYDSKMMLKKVSILDKDVQEDHAYTFTYGGNSKQLQYAPEDVRGDLWGHYRCVQQTPILDLLAPNTMFEPSPGCIEKDVLTKMKLPTGGEIRYNYELNRFNYKPSSITQSQDPTANPIEPITDFSSNLGNWDTMSSYVTINNFGQSPAYFFTITEPQEILFNSEAGNYMSEPWALNFYKLNETTGQMENAMVQALGPLIDIDPNYNPWQKRSFPAGKYYVTLSTVSGNMPHNPIPTNFTARFSGYYRKANNSLHYLSGGGVRIRDIEFYNEKGLQKKKLYEYNDITDPSKSSGALVFPIPVFQYEEAYNNMYLCISPTSTVMKQHGLDMTYNTTSTKNVLSSEKTKGADVGYQFITVKDIDYIANYDSSVFKGKTVHKFSSPIDSPNPLFSHFSMSPPAAYTQNTDYRRGNLLNKKVYDSNNNMLLQEENTYDDHSTTEITGINFLIKNNFIFNRFNTFHIDNYESYKFTMNKCSSMYSFLCEYTSSIGFGVNPMSFVQYYFSKEIVGKTNLIQSKKTQYFPNNKKLTTIEDYTYNSGDYIAKSKSTSSDNTIDETSYKYPFEIGNLFLMNKNMVSVPLQTEIQKNGETISKVESLYPVSQADADTKTSGLALPYQINSTDLSNTVSKEVAYDKYDEMGNVQQYTARDGVSTVIIWGYNKTLPIAKIVGITLSEIPDAVITAVVNSSNADAVNPANESTLISDLVTFRKAIEALPRRRPQITTYTHDPLIGVTSITPPSGIRENYIYDAANRPQQVKNMEQQKVKEMKYNYKH